MEAALQSRLLALANRLIDQQAARIIVAPQQPAAGFWFGGGNMTQGPDGNLYLVGRYRNHGDSRTGLGVGQRGLELAIYRSQDRGESLEKIASFSKADLSVGERDVVSIEGSVLYFGEDGVELFVSTEKTGIGYPPGLESFLKPGTGVWTIDRIAAASIDGLRQAPVETILASDDPRFLHIKDPFVYEPDTGGLMLLFCSHPFCWTSSNTGKSMRKPAAGRFADVSYDFFSRGFTWDVAIARGTAVLDVPRLGAFADRQVRLLFYDGGECVRNHDEHAQAVSRPRGYSCEELGGVAFFESGDLERPVRLSVHQPTFVSPYGTGCSRYVDVLHADGGYYATWQQSQADLSQPLVLNFVSDEEVAQLLA